MERKSLDLESLKGWFWSGYGAVAMGALLGVAIVLTVFHIVGWPE